MDFCGIVDQGLNRGWRKRTTEECVRVNNGSHLCLFIILSRWSRLEIYLLSRFSMLRDGQLYFAKFHHKQPWYLKQIAESLLWVLRHCVRTSWQPPKLRQLHPCHHLDLPGSMQWRCAPARWCREVYLSRHLRKCCSLLILYPLSSRLIRVASSSFREHRQRNIPSCIFFILLLSSSALPA